MNPDTVKIDLLHHEFIKHRDHQKWLFYHIVLGPEQCFHLKSIHLERDEWKVRYYDELIIRTFEPSSIFVTHSHLEFQYRRSSTKRNVVTSERHMPVSYHHKEPLMLALPMLD